MVFVIEICEKRFEAGFPAGHLKMAKKTGESIEHRTLVVMEKNWLNLSKKVGLQLQLEIR